MAGIKSLKGMNDILPEDIGLWQKLERNLSNLMAQYGYREIRMPIAEHTSLFKRGIGEVTDIVEKEMYTFEDKGGNSITLRPEGTAQCVRAGLQHGLLHNQIQRLWYYGPMFRHENPQKERYRQFYQLGVEAYGLQTPDVDAEQIIMMSRLWHICGLQDNIRLKINSLGTPACRQRYRDVLVRYFEENKESLDEDSVRRLSTNPLRILDTKNPNMKALVAHAPKMVDTISDEAKEHFEQLQGLLDKAGVAYDIEPTLVRGLDYYTLTVYEWVTQSLGAQGTVCGGGRYDGLVKIMGGKETPAVGFAMGIERLVALMKLKEDDMPDTLDAYLILMGEQAQSQNVILAEAIRQQCPKIRLLTHCGGGQAKSQFKKADLSGAHMAFIIGDEELAENQLTVKYLRDRAKEQHVVSMDELNKQFSQYQ